MHKQREAGGLAIFQKPEFRCQLMSLQKRHNTWASIKEGTVCETAHPSLSAASTRTKKHCKGHRSTWEFRLAAVFFSR